MVESRIVWSFFDRCDFHFSYVCLKKIIALAEVCSRHLGLSGCRADFFCEEDYVFCVFLPFRFLCNLSGVINTQQVLPRWQTRFSPPLCRDSFPTLFPQFPLLPSFYHPPTQASKHVPFNQCSPRPFVLISLISQTHITHPNPSYRSTFSESIFHSHHFHACAYTGILLSYVLGILCTTK